MALQGGAKAKAGGGKELQLLALCHDRYFFFFFLADVILMQHVARAAEQT